MNHEYLDISQVNNYIKNLLDKDFFLSKVYIKGEISNFKNHSRGHLYFTLKDDNSRINAVMFAGNAASLTFVPKDGDSVLIEGRVSAYPASGSYQIYVDKMELDGIGRLFIEYEKLKKKLAAEGLFNKEHKKQIPKYPRKVGVITADTGAAVKDIISTIKRRFPICEVILFPTLVQGSDAKDNIVKQIKTADTYNLDTLIVGRGGGSIEDLWAFNEEIVARAIFECKTPVISAVGHEIDFTIADFVADYRAATPTGAAEVSVPSKEELKKLINQYRIRMTKNIKTKIETDKKYLNKIMDSYILKSPMSIYEVKEEKLSNYIERSKNVILNIINSNKIKLDSIKSSFIFTSPIKMIEKKYNDYNVLVNKLEILNPLNTLKRGYSITKKDNKVLTSIKNIKKDEMIEVNLSDGIINAKVNEIKEN